MTLAATGRLALSIFGMLVLAPLALGQSATDDVCGALAANPRYLSIPRANRLQFQMFFINCARRVPSPASYSHGASCPAPLPHAEPGCTREPTGEEIDSGRTSCPGAVLYSCQQLTRCMDLEHLTEADATRCPMFQPDNREITCTMMGGFAGYCEQFAPALLRGLRWLGGTKFEDGSKADSDAVAPRSVDGATGRGDGPAVFPGAAESADGANEP